MGEKKKCGCRPGFSRRSFIKGVGFGGLAVAASGRVFVDGARAAEAEMKSGDLAKVVLNINGRDYRLLVEPRESLLFVLREKLGLTGTKAGCERGECGACTVLMDGLTRYSCMTLAVEAEGARIITIEGLMDGERLGPVQQAFVENDAYQCGYCTPGQIMAVEGLLRADPSPDFDAVRRAVSGNLCRCGAYPNIFRAAKRAAELRCKGDGIS
ncbi:MAG: (2Fe-2S)-binding protein [Thermodesulfovibrionales bacterium]